MGLDDERSKLVMIHTISYRRLAPPCPPTPGGRRPRAGDDAGDTLIEVLISALLVVLIVVATLFGLNSSNRATSLDRARSQADALAQEDEDLLRSEPIKKLTELVEHTRTHTATENGTEYTITSSTQSIADATSTSSCNSTNPSSNYLRTSSEVTWSGMGVTKPVIETGIISPTPGSTLIVQTTEVGSPVQAATVLITGTESASLETSVNGCAIFALPPGSFNIDVRKHGYVDENGYTNSDEDPSATHSLYLPAEQAAKQPYALGLAGKLEVTFATSGSSKPEGDTFVAHNSAMTGPRSFGILGTYSTKQESPMTIFPFPASSPYTVYAGTCEADLPSALKSSNVDPTVQVPPEGTGSVTVTEPPVNIKVMSGTGPGASTQGSVVENATGYAEDTGCTTKHTFTSTPHGELPHPGLPFGTYELCAEVAAKNKHWLGTFTNEEASGPGLTWTGEGSSGQDAVIYLGTEPSGGSLKNSAGPCP
jgi:Tfp pilus assembly protein PilV